MTAALDHGSGTIGDNPCTGGNTGNCDDNCQYLSNASRADADANGVGDACEGDTDSDGTAESLDNCSDGVGDACDESGGCRTPLADINHDGAGPDISDLVYMVSYMFSGGPAPVPCP